MKTNFARIIGGAGTGKTTELLRLMEKVIESGISRNKIGFVSFTKAARREASTRAAKIFNCDYEDLEQGGWFRTLHSICYTQLQIGKDLLSGDSKSRKWTSEAIGFDLSGKDDLSLENTGSEKKQAITDADMCLALWSVSRNRMKPLREIYERSSKIDDRIPSYEFCLDVIEKYEHAKNQLFKCDFTDILGRFAGVKFGIEEHSETIKEGEIPDVDVWFLDEQQDTSALLDLVCKRLTESSRWSYICGDPFQSIYGFAGSDAGYFMEWPIQEGKQRILPKSYRCPKEIHELGERILGNCSNYFDRGIDPADHDGEIHKIPFSSSWPKEIDPRDSWLLLARTNQHVHRITQRLNKYGIPWVTTKGVSSLWNAPKRRTAMYAMWVLQQGLPITADEWREVISILKSGDHIFRGTKKRWSKDYKPDSNLANIDSLTDYGATESFIDSIRDGSWTNIKGIQGFAQKYSDAFTRWGFDVVKSPNVMIGTIHSAKGMEADNVVLLTTTTRQVDASMSYQDGADEEYRLAYVAVTRAKRRLYIASENCLHVMKLTKREKCESLSY